MTLAQQILDLIATPFSYVVGWFYSLFNSIGLLGFLIATILFLLICSTILIPLRGSGVGAFGALKSVSSRIKDSSEPRSRK